jgi:hypothetical protein
MTEIHKTKPDEIEELFQTFQLSKQDELAGQQFNLSQRAVLHNLRAMYCQQKMAELFTPADVIGFAQREAELRGKIDLLSALLLPVEVPDEEIPN